MYAMPFKEPVTLGVFATKEEAEAHCGTTKSLLN
nr:MAG TPA: Endolytic peptidoglycan transglycosylase RlpA [Caudoviricetes sp.]